MFQLNNDNNFARLDYQILIRGSVKSYRDNQSLEKDIAWLQSENYQFKRFDCENWTDKETMYDDLHTQFDFPAYFGRNYDALQESLNEEEIQDNGLTVVFYNFDRVPAKTAHTLLDIFSHSSRHHLIFGKRLLLLIRIGEDFKTEPFGSFSLNW